MNEKKVRLLVKNIESLIETLKYELECGEEEQHTVTPTFLQIPSDQIDEVFHDEN